VTVLQQICLGGGRPPSTPDTWKEVYCEFKERVLATADKLARAPAGSHMDVRRTPVERVVAALCAGKRLAAAGLLPLPLLGASCTGNNSTVSEALQASIRAAYSVGGSLTGLTGGKVVLQDNGADTLQVSADGTFTFPTELTTGESYSVSVLTQPTSPPQTCTVSQGTGTVSSAAVTNVSVSCVSKTTTEDDTVGGVASGVQGSGLVLALQTNGQQIPQLPVNANGPFSFQGNVTSGSTYDVSVVSYPSNQVCSITNGNGTASATDISNVLVSCQTSTSSYSISSTVEGLEGGSNITLLLNGNLSNEQTFSANGTKIFQPPVPAGGAYDVTVENPPNSSSTTCTVSGGAGVAESNVTVTVLCIPSVLVTVSGLSVGETATITNGTDSITVPANGNFWLQPTTSGGYDVTVTPSTGEQCSPSNNIGNVLTSSTPVTVSCGPQLFYVSVEVTGPASFQGQPLELQLNGTQTQSASGSGTYRFPTPLAYGSTATVDIIQQAGVTTTVGGLTQATIPCWLPDDTSGQLTVNANVTMPVQCVANPLGFLYIMSEGEVSTLASGDITYTDINPYFIDAAGELYNLGPYGASVALLPGTPDSNYPIACAADVSLAADGYPYLATVNAPPYSESAFPLVVSEIDANTGFPDFLGGIGGADENPILQSAASSLSVYPYTLSGGVEPVYLTDSVNNTVTSLEVGVVGIPPAFSLGLNSVQSTSSGPSASTIAYTEFGNYVIVADQQANDIEAFPINSDGSLGPEAAAGATGSAPMSVAPYSVIIHSEFSAGYLAYYTLLYVANSGDDTISEYVAYTTSATSGLTLSSVGTISVGPGLTALSTDSVLLPLTGQPNPGAQNPILYAASTSGVSSFSIITSGSSTGQLSYIGTVAAGANPVSISAPVYYSNPTVSGAVTAGYLFVANSGDGTVSEYSLTISSGLATGGLTLINTRYVGGAPTAACAAPRPIQAE
jgi:hypothetical protein